MTAGAMDVPGINTWLRSWSTPRIIAVKAETEQAPTTLGRESADAARAAVLYRILDLSIRVPNVQPSALVRLVTWISTLPAGVPEPFIAIGDDGSISSEWD